MSDMLRKLAASKRAEQETLEKVTKTIPSSPKIDTVADEELDNKDQVRLDVSDNDALGGEKSGRRRNHSKKTGKGFVIEPKESVIEPKLNVSIKLSSMDKLALIKSKTKKPYYQIIEELLNEVDYTLFE